MKTFPTGAGPAMSAQALSQATARFMTHVYTWMAFGIALTAVVSYEFSTRPDLVQEFMGNPFLLWGSIILQLGAVFFLSAAIHRIPSAVAIVVFGAYAALTGLTFDGVAEVATATGKVAMLKFSLSSLTLSDGAALTYSFDGRSPVTRAAELGLSGDIVLYATKLSGELDGAMVTYTPAAPPSGLASDITITDFVTDQPDASADMLTGAGLEMTDS